mmetsp:Transcript_23420/g.41067  ORF Transcript_23420/g.41067 Transcript_23420/m.41067 type:complete len:208 (+) Transcript_23420:4316-4939(+)
MRAPHPVHQMDPGASIHLERIDLGRVNHICDQRRYHFFLPNPDRPGGRAMPPPPRPGRPPGILPPICLAAASSWAWSMPPISGMPPLPNMPFMACFSMPPLPLPSFFIMSAICRCIFSSLLRSLTCIPDPRAIRFFRLACKIWGAARSFLVMDWIMAICCFKTLSSKPASCTCLAILPMPGIMPIIPSMPPILTICSSCMRRSFMLN